MAADLGSMAGGASSLQSDSVSSSCCSGVAAFVDGLMNGVKLLCCNVGGLSYDKFCSLCSFLVKFDIICLTETWLEIGAESRFEIHNFVRIVLLGPHDALAGGDDLGVSSFLSPIKLNLIYQYLRYPNYRII